MKSEAAFHPDEDFEQFLGALTNNGARQWNWLIAKFRQKLIPFLNKRIHSYPQWALLSKSQFIEEVIEETLLQFFKIFKTGSFSSYSDLEATVITTAGFQLKAGFGRLKKEQRIYFMEAEALSALQEKHGQSIRESASGLAENIADIKNKLNQLESEEKDLLLRFYNGEELKDIADDLAISPSACRKRKQRILEKLRDLVIKTISLLILSSL